MIPDVFLNEIAKAINSESFVVPAYLAFGTDTLSALSSDTSLAGETGSRVLVTKSRSGNTISHNGLKTGASITSSTGTVLYSSALFSASTSGVLCSEIPITAGLTHTTAFDIEVDWNIIINRES
jgi:hypothetical protein